MKKLIFVTSKYPYGNGETFIENEIQYLSEHFEKVFIYASDADPSEEKRILPDNVSVLAANPGKASKLNCLGCLFRPLVFKEIFRNCLTNNAFAKVNACCFFYATYLKKIKKLDSFLQLCDLHPDDDVVVYSYWLSTIGMCALKIKKRLEKRLKRIKCVSRCHGFDVYSDRNFINYLPFQEYMVERFDKVFPCAKAGERYLKEKYPSQKDKISAEYLGVEDHFNNKFPRKDNVFSIVSCSNVIPVKRVHLIAKALSKITDKEILWTHFGDGEDFDDLRHLADQILPQNIKYEFKGRVPNAQIYDFYNENNVNLFINVSSSEGLPVSIMEAISFGIPVIATDVGGTSEIVEDGVNGYLLTEDFTIDVLSNLITKVIGFSEQEYFEYCKNSRRIYERSFKAKKTFSDFCDKILSIN